MTSLRPAAILFIALAVVGGSSGTGKESQPAATPSQGSTASAGDQPFSADSASPATNVSVTLDLLTNRHAISPYVYGGAYPQDAATITDSGLTTVRMVMIPVPTVLSGVVTTATRVPQRRAGDTALDDAGTAALIGWAAATPAPQHPCCSNPGHWRRERNACTRHRTKRKPETTEVKVKMT